MSSDSVTVRFTSAGAAVQIRVGQTLADAAREAGVPLPTPCGGIGTCGKCKVKILEGEVTTPSEAEQRMLPAEELEEGIRLGCQVRPTSDVRVDVISTSDVVVRKELSLQSFREFTISPRVQRLSLDLPEPELDDQRSDFLRVCEAATDDCANFKPSLRFLQKLPTVLRDNGYNIAVTRIGDRVVEIEPSAMAPDPLGVAVDIGTTTCVAYIINLATGELVATGSTLNPQSAHGADVVSRIEHVVESDEGLHELQTEIVATINAMTEEAIADIGASTDHIYEMTVVGNTAMHHLFLGIDPRSIARSPYVPVMSEPVRVYARHLGLETHPDCQVFTLPIIAGFVGADTVGVMTAVDITSREPTLAVDIGTNGEIVVWSGQRLLCASTAAGPAFEGAQIAQGMYAAPGAISEVDLVNGDLQVRTIDNEPARGICGSALFDITACLLDTGALGENGRLAEDASDLGPIGDRIVGEGNDRRVILADGDDAQDGRPVYLSQKDIREIQLAKGAVRAGVELLLEEAGMQADDLQAVLLAGAFGNHIRPASAMRMGIFPDIGEEKVTAVGNAAGAGAAMALLSSEERGRACELAKRAEHIELSRSVGFQQKFMETMLFA